MILVVGGSPEDGRWLEDALKPSGLAVTVRSLEDALAPPPSETRVRPEVLVSTSAAGARICWNPWTACTRTPHWARRRWSSWTTSVTSSA